MNDDSQSMGILGKEHILVGGQSLDGLLQITLSFGLLQIVSLEAWVKVMDKGDFLRWRDRDWS